MKPLSHTPRVVVASLALAGCARTGYQDAEPACPPSACGEHGHCLVDARDEPFCVCDPGYQPRGLDCLPEGQPDGGSRHDGRLADSEGADLPRSDTAWPDAEREDAGLPCVPGAHGPGGLYLQCGPRYDLIIMPAGCGAQTIEPPCSGVSGDPEPSRSWGSLGEHRDLAMSAGDGAQNSVNLLAYSEVMGLGTHPAAEHCDALRLEGYDDWYLPALEELRLVSGLAGPLGLADDIYQSSTDLDGVLCNAVNMADCTTTSVGKGTPAPLRCVRRHGAPLPRPRYDLAPDALSLQSITTARGQRVTSQPWIVRGVSAPVSVQLHGVQGDPAYTVNAGPEQRGPGTLRYGDALRLRMTAPDTADSTHTVTVEVGEVEPCAWSVATGCVPGGFGAGGVFIRCAPDYALVATEALAEGGQLSWGAEGIARGPHVQHPDDGPLNTVNLVSLSQAEGGGVHAAAEYCMELVHGGYDDWYLPAKNELGVIGSLHLRVDIGIAMGYGDHYLSSTESTRDPEVRVWHMRYALLSDNNDLSKSELWRVRCTRREGQPPPAPSVPLPPSLEGAWVLSAGTYSGGLGDLDGANATCLQELTDHDWLGKAALEAAGRLAANKVRAFLCRDNFCQNPAPSTRYVFARSGAPTVGGASFITDDQGRGPGNTEPWSGASHFDGAVEFWTGPRATDAEDLWGTGPNGSQYDCNAWQLTINPSTIGSSVASGSERWLGNTSTACALPYHLICMVQP